MGGFMSRIGKKKVIVGFILFGLVAFLFSAPLRGDDLSNLTAEQRIAAEGLIKKTSICSSPLMRVRSFELDQRTRAAWNVSCGPSVLSVPALTEKVQCLDGELLVEWVRDAGSAGPCPAGIEILY